MFILKEMGESSWRMMEIGSQDYWALRDNKKPIKSTTLAFADVGKWLDI